MIDMSDREQVGALKSNLHAVFDTPQGQEVMRFLEISCKWYSSVWDPQNPDMTLINDGKRQVIATIKTMLELSPDQIVTLASKNAVQE
jgi:hypothetical protein